MFEPYPLGLAGGRRSDRHGVIERHPALAFSRPFLDPRDIAAHRSVAEHGAQIPALGQRGAEVQPSLTGRASSIRTPTSCRICCDRRRGSRASRSGRSCSCTPIWRRWAMTAPTIAWRLSPANGRPPGSASRRPRAGASSCPWRSRPARRSSSTGRRTGRSSPASGPSCRSPTSSSATAAPSFSAPIRSRRTRCCSTPTITPSACWAAFRGAASTTTCEPPSTGSGAARSGRSTRASRPWSATSCSRRSSAIRRRAGRRGRSRRTSRTPAIGFGSRRRASPPWRR